MRERPIIKEGEGKPIDWLLIMATSQDLDAGTVHMDMKLAITQLAHGILSPEETEKAKGVRYLVLATPLGKLTER